MIFLHDVAGQVLHAFRKVENGFGEVGEVLRA